MKKRDILKKLSVGDKIQLTSGEEVTFCRLKRTKFYAIPTGKTEVVGIPVDEFAEVLEKAIPNPEKDRIRELAKRYKGTEIETDWGPSIVGDLTDDMEYVILYEGGEEEYTLTLENFDIVIRESNS